MICGIPVRVKREMFVASLFFYALSFFERLSQLGKGLIKARKSLIRRPKLVPEKSKPVHFCTGSQHQTIKWIKPNQ